MPRLLPYVHLLGVVPDRDLAAQFAVSRTSVTNARWSRGIAPAPNGRQSVPKNTRPLADRFWAKVDKNGPEVRVGLGECWVWTAAKDRRGYGKIGDDGATKIAPRVAWEIEHGASPGDRCVLHHCDNPGCVRPSHLFLGTAADNAADKVAKGRQSTKATGLGWHCMGERNPLARHSDDDVREARRLREAGARITDLAARYGVHRTTIRGWLDGSGRVAA
jgi:hypothetical protein